MKRLFGQHRAGYFRLAETDARMAMAAIGQNLLKAANKNNSYPASPGNRMAPNSQPNRVRLIASGYKNIRRPDKTQKPRIC